MNQAVYALMRVTLYEFADRIDALASRVAALEQADSAPAEPLVWPPIDLGPIATEDQRYWNG